jgi:predicted N-formylglutamate amidohydrolase
MLDASSTDIVAESAEAYEILAGRTGAGLVLICDHACNALPDGYGTLGLHPDQLRRHIAYDIGAAEVTRRVAAALHAPAVLSRHSRLLIDPNRGLDDPTLVMRLSDGALIPGNRNVDEAERERRIALYYRPYHDAIARMIDACIRAGTRPALLAIHSFTESWKGVPRPWHASVLWDVDVRLAKPLLDALWKEGDLIIGENAPYAGQYEGDTLWQHGTQRGLAHAIVELRQDLVRDEAGQRQWANRLARHVTSILATPDIAATFHTVPPDAAVTGARPSRALNDKEVTMAEQDDKLRTEFEAAAFRRLVEHLRTRTDVQNIDLMNLAGFCRNCLANWYQEAANKSGQPLDRDGARALIYGMPYKDWQAKYQTEATPAQKAAYEKNKPHQH